MLVLDLIKEDCVKIAYLTQDFSTYLKIKITLIILGFVLNLLCIHIFPLFYMHYVPRPCVYVYGKSGICYVYVMKSSPLRPVGPNAF